MINWDTHQRSVHQSADETTLTTTTEHLRLNNLRRERMLSGSVECRLTRFALQIKGHSIRSQPDVPESVQKPRKRRMQGAASTHQDRNNNNSNNNPLCTRRRSRRTPLRVRGGGDAVPRTVGVLATLHRYPRSSRSSPLQDRVKTGHNEFMVGELSELWRDKKYRNALFWSQTP